MPELRRDYIVNRWVSIATERGRRPKLTGRIEVKKGEVSCPFCPGNEYLTPPAYLVYVRDGKDVKEVKDGNSDRVKNWIVRCFQNLYPAFTRDTATGMYSPWVYGDPYGYHEVVVESPNHNDDLWNIGVEQLSLALKAMFKRALDIQDDDKVKYVSIFKNHGVQAGASIAHPHFQIIAVTLVPDIIAEEAEKLKEDNCIYCKVAEIERESPRYVLNSKEFIVLAPWASRTPYELLILPVKHMETPLKMGEEDITALAETLTLTFRAFNKLLGNIDFNLWIHHAPKNHDFHWHIEVVPKTAIWAGLELGIGVFINTLPPEKAAEEFRGALGELAVPSR